VAALPFNYLKFWLAREVNIMNIVFKFIPTIILTFLFLAGTCSAQNDLLNRVPQLQETAARASGGVLGCGEGSYLMVTSRGQFMVSSGLDAIHVFGGKIVVADLLTLLEARNESNRTGEKNQMSGEIGSFMYVILSVLQDSKDPDVIPVIGQLLKDKNEQVVFQSFYALQKLAKSGEELQFEVEKVVFPKTAVELFKARKVELPEWAKVEEK
jgi:hypothetical protein